MARQVAEQRNPVPRQRVRQIGEEVAAGAAPGDGQLIVSCVGRAEISGILPQRQEHIPGIDGGQLGRQPIGVEGVDPPVPGVGIDFPDVAGAWRNGEKVQKDSPASAAEFFRPPFSHLTIHHDHSFSAMINLPYWVGSFDAMPSKRRSILRWSALSALLTSSANPMLVPGFGMDSAPSSFQGKSAS